jgi:hypothetical protein
MAKNSHFLDQVSKIFGKDDGIIVVCVLTAQISSLLSFIIFHYITKETPVICRDVKVAGDLSWQQLS